MKEIKHGDFSSLAEKYSRYRPLYSPSVVHLVSKLLDGSLESADVADVGAGTGIWTRMLASIGPRSLTAVEPNDAMRARGELDSKEQKIRWLKGCAEDTRLGDSSVDLLTMASSFHWADFELATKEFYRTLRRNGKFITLWNPRLIEQNPLLKETEEYLYELEPSLKRVSSGKSEFVESLSERLNCSPLFRDVLYVEGRHVSKQTKDHYIGAWKSSNDVPHQLGVAKFKKFLNFLNERLRGDEPMEVTYLTRAWIATVAK